MRTTRKTPALTLALATASLAAMAVQHAAASGLTTLYTFTGGADGFGPFAGLLPGLNGSFFGTTTGASGSVFQLLPPAQAQTSWTLKTLYSFTGGADGAFPQTLVMDKAGALYGMTDEGGIFNGT
jgi:hypothetical protein